MRVLLLLLALWTTCAVGFEVWSVSTAPRPGLAGPPSMWRPGDPGLTPLRTLLRAAARRLPAGAVVVVEASGHDPGERFFFMAWCAYELPRQRVLRREHLPPEGGFRYLLRLAPEGADPLADAPAGAEPLLVAERLALWRLAGATGG